MDLAVVAITFGLIFVAELPDKTMIATLVMASRHRPLAVWVGTATAFIVHAGLAAGAGRLLLLLPHRAVEGVVTALFTVGAAYLLLRKEESETQAGEEQAAKAERFHRIAAGAFAVIFVGEFGDLTQILTANLAAHYRQPWSVFVGAALGLMSVSALGVISGRALVRVLPLHIIRKAGGCILAAFAIYSAVTLAGG